MQAGRLRYSVEIQDYTQAQDSNGDDIRDYFEFATVRADIVSKGGRELYAAQQQFAEANAVITIRYLEGVEERMRIYHAAEATYYDILNVAPGGRGRRAELLIICKTGALEDPEVVL